MPFTPDLIYFKEQLGATMNSVNSLKIQFYKNYLRSHWNFNRQLTVFPKPESVVSENFLEVFKISFNNKDSMS